MPFDPTPLRRRFDEAAPDPLNKLYNPHAEQCLLGGLFFSNRAYEAVCDIVCRDDFGNALHGRIFEAIGKLIERGQEAHPATVAPLFADDEVLEKAGGRQYLKTLADSAVTVINARDYALCVADLAKRREIILAARDMIADAAEYSVERPADSVLDEGEERLFQIGERRRNLSGGPIMVRDSVASVLDAVEAAYKAGSAQTLQTGLADLDKIIGGMAGGEMVVIAGRPSMGKTACAGTIAFNAARTGKKVLVFTLEMKTDRLTRRWLAGESGISTDRQRAGQLDGTDWSRLIAAGDVLKKLPLFIDDQPRLSIAQMRLRARRQRRRQGLDLIIIDYLQLVRLGGKQESRRLEIGDASGQVQALAKELDVPIVLLSQLNRAVESREDKRPGLADLKESGDIEQDADIILFLFREEYYLLRSEPRKKADEPDDKFRDRYMRWMNQVSDARGRSEIIIAKNRDGRTGVVPVAFAAARQRFENLFRETGQ